MDLPEQVTDNREYFYFICTLCCHNLLCFNRPILIIKTCKGTDFDFVIWKSCICLCWTHPEPEIAKHEVGRLIREIFREEQKEENSRQLAWALFPAAHIQARITIEEHLCLCDTSEPSQARLHCDTFPDYRVSSLNIGFNFPRFPVTCVVSHPVVTALACDSALWETPTQTLSHLVSQLPYKNPTESSTTGSQLPKCASCSLGLKW